MGWVRRLPFGIGIVVGIAIVSSCQTREPFEDVTDNDYPQTLLGIKAEIQGALNDLDQALFEASRAIAEHGLDSDQTRQILRGLCEGRPYVVDCSTVDPQGLLVAVEPPDFRALEGEDISSQDQVKQVRKSKGPVLSTVFTAIEGVQAIDLEWPVIAGDGEFLGSVSMLMEPSVFLATYIEPALQGVPVDSWVIQIDGTTLYDPDPEEIGRNILTDTLYDPFPDLRRFARQLLRSPSGTGTYEFYATDMTEPVTKRAYWTTVALHGVEWRLGLVQVLAGDPEAARRAFSDLELMQSRDTLRALSKRSELVGCMTRGNEDAMVELLREFHSANPGLYAVEWITPAGVTRLGYPPANSLRNYDHKAGSRPGDAELARYADAGAEAWMDINLAEGGKGILFLCPVKLGVEYVGSLYFIRLYVE